MIVRQRSGDQISIEQADAPVQRLSHWPTATLIPRPENYAPTERRSVSLPLQATVLSQLANMSVLQA